MTLVGSRELGTNGLGLFMTRISILKNYPINILLCITKGTLAPIKGININLKGTSPRERIKQGNNNKGMIWKKITSQHPYPRNNDLYPHEIMNGSMIVPMKEWYDLVQFSPPLHEKKDKKFKLLDVILTKAYIVML
jgi:hypothetical protein